jgi:hypothetical protein
LDAASTTGQSLGFRVKGPQKQTLRVDIAAGVFSETWNYIERAKIRPENFLSNNKNTPSANYTSRGVVKTWEFNVKDKGAAQLL